MDKLEDLKKLGADFVNETALSITIPDGRRSIPDAPGGSEMRRFVMGAFRPRIDRSLVANISF